MILFKTSVLFNIIRYLDFVLSGKCEKCVNSKLCYLIVEKENLVVTITRILCFRTILSFHPLKYYITAIIDIYVFIFIVRTYLKKYFELFIHWNPVKFAQDSVK